MRAGMLKGFTVPKSPFAQAPLTPPLTDDRTVAEAWIEEGELYLPEAHGEEVLAPSRVVSGFRYSLSHSVTGLRILVDHTS
jgi:hypothetical protein